MKKLIILAMLTVTISHSSQAQIRQSFFSIPGVIEHLIGNIFGNDQPYKYYEINYSSSEELLQLNNPLQNIDNRLPNLEGTFSFTNSNESFEGDYIKDLGVCRCYSSLRLKFRYLSVFDKNNEIVASPANMTKKEKRKWIKFYRKIVKDIRNFKPRVIPGFASLYEMSQHPDLSDMMKWQVLHEWRDKNFSYGTGTGELVRGVFRKSKMEELLEMRTRIEFNAKLGHNTMIWLSERHSTWIHVLEAIDVSPIQVDGSFTVTFWNDKFTELDRARSVLTVQADGSIHYDDTIEKREINAAGVTADNDGELKFFSEKLNALCNAYPELCRPE